MNLAADSNKRKRNLGFLFFFVFAVLAACSASTRQLFFDIPPQPEEPPPAQQLENENSQPGRISGEVPQWVIGDDSERPEIEGILDWTEAQEFLPKHPLGGVDWIAAVDQDIIKPRTGEGGPPRFVTEGFQWDFFLQGPAPNFDAYFPHSKHTQWMGCRNCHSTIYPYKENEMKMADLYAGKSCAVCHGRVAFPVTQCKRCHTKM